MGCSDLVVGILPKKPDKVGSIPRTERDFIKNPLIFILEEPYVDGYQDLVEIRIFPLLTECRKSDLTAQTRTTTRKQDSSVRNSSSPETTSPRQNKSSSTTSRRSANGESQNNVSSSTSGRNMAQNQETITTMR